MLDKNALSKPANFTEASARRTRRHASQKIREEPGGGQPWSAAHLPVGALLRSPAAVALLLWSCSACLLRRAGAGAHQEERRVLQAQLPARGAGVVRGHPHLQPHLALRSGCAGGRLGLPAHRADRATRHRRQAAQVRRAHTACHVLPSLMYCATAWALTRSRAPPT